jgi:ATP-dependent RNA helicase DOB1
MMYFEVLKRFEQGKTVPLLDPIKDMDIESKTLVKLMASKDTILKELSLGDIKDLNPNQEQMFERKSELKTTIKDLSDSIRKSADMIMSTELVSMKRVMRRLDLCDRNDVPTLKGKVAAHISTSDEILLTEMLFSGLFNDMEQPAHIAAVLSCLVYTEGKAGSQEGI